MKQIQVNKGGGLFIIIFLVIGNMGVIAEPNETKSLSEYRNEIKSSLRTKEIKYETQNRLTSQEKKIIQLLTDESADPSTRREEIVTYVRSRYIEAPMDQPKHLYSDYNIRISGFPAALLWLYGDPAGIYEYTKLTGMDSINCMDTNVDMAADPDLFTKLLRYELHIVTDSIKNNLDMLLVENAPALQTDYTSHFQQLLQKFDQDPILIQYLLQYPFLKGSFIDLEPAPAVKAEKLYDYYAALFLYADQKNSFVKTAASELNKTTATEFLRILLDRESDPAVIKTLISTVVTCGYYDLLDTIKDSIDHENADTAELLKAELDALVAKEKKLQHLLKEVQINMQQTP